MAQFLLHIIFLKINGLPVLFCFMPEIAAKKIKRE